MGGIWWHHIPDLLWNWISRIKTLENALKIGGKTKPWSVGFSHPYKMAMVSAINGEITCFQAQPWAKHRSMGDSKGIFGEGFYPMPCWPSPRTYRNWMELYHKFFSIPNRDNSRSPGFLNFDPAHRSCNLDRLAGSAALFWICSLDPYQLGSNTHLGSSNQIFIPPTRYLCSWWGHHTVAEYVYVYKHIYVYFRRTIIRYYQHAPTVALPIAANLPLLGLLIVNQEAILSCQRQ